MSALYGDLKSWPSRLKTISVISVKGCLTSRSRAADAVKCTVKSGCGGGLVFFTLFFSQSACSRVHFTQVTEKKSSQAVLVNCETLQEQRTPCHLWLIFTLVLTKRARNINDLVYEMPYFILTDVYSLPEVDGVSLSHCITLFHGRKKKKTWLQTFLKTNSAVVAVS